MTCACADDEHRGLVAFRGTRATLLGEIGRIGMPASDFAVFDAGFRPVRLSDFRGEKVLVNSFPGLDRDSALKELADLAKLAAGKGDVRLLAIGMDLPYALERIAADAPAGVLLLSDHRDADFGRRNGLFMREFRLLARAVLAIDEAGRLRHQEIVADAAGPADLEKALRAFP
ncbi:MAG: redoxin family protein [Planctomycetota bacterium]|jgi:thiol peroxidase|nr:redoxin family protein [Planctomycetota bacterium]